MGLQYSHGMEILFLVKRPNYFYRHPLPLTVGYPPLDTTRPPLFTTRPPSATASAARLPPVTAEPLSARHRTLPFAIGLRQTAKGIFENEQNILRNSICLPNTPKNICLGKLFPGITFLGIGFSKTKIQTSYQMPS